MQEWPLVCNVRGFGKYTRAQAGVVWVLPDARGENDVIDLKDPANQDEALRHLDLMKDQVAHVTALVEDS